MAEEKNTMPELTLTPNDTAAAAAQAVPDLTLCLLKQYISLIP